METGQKRSKISPSPINQHKFTRRETVTPDYYLMKSNSVVTFAEPEHNNFTGKVNSDSNLRQVQPIYSKFFKKSFSSTLSRDENLSYVQTIQEQSEEIQIISPSELNRHESTGLINIDSRKFGDIRELKLKTKKT